MICPKCSQDYFHDYSKKDFLLKACNKCIKAYFDGIRAFQKPSIYDAEYPCYCSSFPYITTKCSKCRKEISYFLSSCFIFYMAPVYL